MNAIGQRKGFECRAYTLESKSRFIEVGYNTIKEKFKYNLHLSEVGNEMHSTRQTMLSSVRVNVHWLRSMRLIDKTELENLQVEFSLKKVI